jgi:isopentenyl diphosphate isomerase/L-lactate dehydrogenase-like FMN-dependent dehydrogenase
MTDPRNRRAFLRLLAASPALPLVPDLLRALIEQQPGLISAPDQAINVFDFEPVAKKELPPAHFGYLATGVDDDATLRANREGFNRYALRMRRLVDIRQIDTSLSIFGTRLSSPIILSPVSSQRAFHPEGEIAVAKAARTKDHHLILSTLTTTTIEDVVAARAAPVWFQLYPTDQWPITQALVRRAAAAGTTALVLTVDLQGGSNREALNRAAMADSRDCSGCHPVHPLRFSTLTTGRKKMFDGIDVSKVGGLEPLEMNWDYVTRLRGLWAGKLLIKGIVTREDAELATKHGVDGVIVSNHGGRAEESGRASIESLSEVVEGVRGKMPVLIDGGFRRGTDIFKALALGATAICIGRPYLWGLAAFGQPGVEAVLTLLRAELDLVMRQAGTVRLAAINRAYLVDRGRS